MIEIINANLAAIAGSLISLATILGFRKNIWKILYGAYRFFTAPSRVEKKLDELIVRGDAREVELKKINYALFNDGKDGMVNQMALTEKRMARLCACQAANFESAPYPSFEYTSGGATTSVNEAYRVLIGAWSQSIIGAGRWQQAVTGELAEDYIHEQERCSMLREDFIGVCDFKNPMTDQPRGRWRVHASAAQIGDDCIYIGRFVAALDDVAREIARDNGWSVKMR